jgi:hypothetical protein
MSHQIGDKKQSERNTGTEEGQRREMDSLTSGTEEGLHSESVRRAQHSATHPGSVGFMRTRGGGFVRTDGGFMHIIAFRV